MAIKKIITKNNDLLRKRSSPVITIDQNIRDIFTDMADTMRSRRNGGGLAACQIGILNRMIIVDMGGGLLKLVNPQITHAEGEQVALEGCLSCPGIVGRVKRPQRIVVKALNALGRPVTINATDELARCLCHEIDHLDGILMIDKFATRADG